MLRELLRLVETAEGPISLAELSRQLGVDAAVLDVMLLHWVLKCRLGIDGRSARACANGGGCMPGGCGSCAGLTHCPFVARLPVTYRLTLHE